MIALDNRIGKECPTMPMIGRSRLSYKVAKKLFFHNIIVANLFRSKHLSHNNFDSGGRKDADSYSFGIIIKHRIE